MSRKRIAIITGGNSSELVISLKSAEQVMQMMNAELYEAVIIRIVGNQWLGYSDEIRDLPVDKNDFSIQKEGKKISFDCAFIMIHGTPGENGFLQSYFELLGMPYTTGGVFNTALTFNKYATKLFLKNFGIKSAETIRLKTHDFNPELIIEKVGLPCFVKPNEGGSSYGISRVNRAEELISAVQKARQEDDTVLVEEFIEGTEITCGIVKTSGDEFIFPITEIVSKTDFFDTKAKYEGLSEEITPARVPEEIAQQCKQLTSQIYDLTDCRGIVRIDYIVKNGELYFLEVNAVPGMSANSIIPQQIRAYGKVPADVLTLVIENAIAGMKKSAYKE